MTEHDGLSGADLFRGTLDDGTRVVVKRSTPSEDLFQRLLGNANNLELDLWEEGIFDRLPATVSSPTIGGWVDSGGTWIVMRDLGGRILGADHAFDERELDYLLRALDAMHNSGLRPKATIPLSNVIGVFSPKHVAAIGDSHDLASRIDRGWSVFRDFTSPRLGARIVELASDPGPLISALVDRPAGFCHGDVAGVNMAWNGNGVVLLDWGQAFVGPPSLDIARFLPSGLRSSPLNNDDLISQYRELVAERFDPDGFELSLLAAFIWYGWQKALDATQAVEPQRSAVERANMEWWSERVPRALRLIEC